MKNKFNLAKWLTTNVIVFIILLFLSIAFPIESCKLDLNKPDLNSLVSKGGDATTNNTNTPAIEQNKDEAKLQQLALTPNSGGNNEPDGQQGGVPKLEPEPGDNSLSASSSRQLSLPQQENGNTPLSDEPKSVNKTEKVKLQQGDNNSERKLSNQSEKESTNEQGGEQSGGQNSPGQEKKQKKEKGNDNQEPEDQGINLQPEGQNKLEVPQPITVLEEGKGEDGGNDNQEPEDQGINLQPEGPNKSKQAQPITVVEGKGKGIKNNQQSQEEGEFEADLTRIKVKGTNEIEDKRYTAEAKRQSNSEESKEKEDIANSDSDLEVGVDKSQEEFSITKEEIEEINTKADKLSGKILSPILNFFNITTTAVGSVSIYKDEAVSTLTTAALVCLALLSLVSLLIRTFTSYIPKAKIWFRYLKMDEDSKKLILKDFGKEVRTSVFDFLVEFFRFVSQGLLLFAGSDLMGEGNVPTILVAIGALFSFIALTITIAPVIYTGIGKGYTGLSKGWSFLKRNLLEEKID